MAIKKSQLYASLWQSCDELRGGMDASQYKDYILTLLFMKYVSDKTENDPYALITVPEGGDFSDMVALIGNRDIGEKINVISSRFANANDLNGVINQADFDDNTVFNEQMELPRYSRIVPFSEIADPANAYNLNIPRYIDTSEPEDLHDLGAHLNGGIPDTDIDALADYWQVFPTLRNAVFKANGRPGYSDPLVETQQVKTTILTHPEFDAYQQQVSAVFQAWRAAHEQRLLAIDVGNPSPREIIYILSEALLSRFNNGQLIDRYDVYQELMDYSDEVMQDDVYLIASDGWGTAAKPREVIQNRQVKEPPDLVIKKRKYKMDLIPPALIVARYFADEQEVIEMLAAKQAAATSTLEAYIEEHTGEDGWLADAVNDKGNITVSSVKARLVEAFSARVEAHLLNMGVDWRE